MSDIIEKQKLASNPLYSAWVGASAGTGKTKILTDRVIRLLLHDVDPNQILCLTYTRSAAKEMIDRIHSQLSNWAIITDEQLKQELSDISNSQITEQDISKARSLFAKIMHVDRGVSIKTIHAFCFNLLSRFFMEAELPHNCTIAQEGTDHLIHDAIRFLLKSDREFHTNFENLFQHTHYKYTLKIIRQAVKKKEYFEYWKQNNQSDDYISQLLCEYLGLKNICISQGKSIPDEDIYFQDFYHSHINNKLPCLAEQSLSHASKTDRVLIEFLIDWYKLEDIKAKENLPQYIKLLSKKKIITGKLAKLMPDLEQKLIEEKTYISDCFNNILNIRFIHKNNLLYKIVHPIIQEYMVLKLQNKLMEYDDVIHYCLTLLSNTEHSDWIKYKLEHNICHILVDEAQDTSLIQWNIIDKLCEEFFASNHPGTLFAVGDIKQSIYSFQDAAPSEFIQAGKYFEQKAKDAHKNFAIVTLNHSFRTTAPILTLVDSLCNDQELNRSINLAQISVQHIPYFQDQKGYVALIPALPKEEEDSAEPQFMKPALKNDDHIIKDAKLITSHVKDLVVTHNVDPADIMILVRKRDKLYYAIIKQLINSDIPCSGADKITLNEHLAVQDLIALGEFLLYPHNDLRLVGLLKSPFFYFKEQEIFYIAYDREKKSVWENICLIYNELIKNPNFCKHKISQETANKIIDCKQYLDHLMQAQKHFNIYELYHLIIYKYQAIKSFKATLGQEAVDAIHIFLDQILKYQRNTSSLLRNFIQYIKTTEIEFKNEFSGNDVRVMTIHSSKGLQSPYVLMVDQGYRVKNDNRILSIDTEQGNIPTIRPLAEETSNEIKQILHDNEQALYEEYWRLLYVALTRSKFYLYIFTTDSKSPWYSKLSEIMLKIGAKINSNEEEGDGICVYDPYNQYPALPLANDEDNDQVIYMYNSLPKQQDFYKLPDYIDKNEKYDFYSKNYGICVHKILETLAQDKYNQYTTDQLSRAVSNIYKMLKPALPNNIIPALINEVVQVRSNKNLHFLFSQHSMSEVSFVEGKVHIIIDKIVIYDNQIIIADFKTGDITEDNLLQYKKQMALYKKIVGKIYKQRNITCYLVLTRTADLMEI